MAEGSSGAVLAALCCPWDSSEQKCFRILSLFGLVKDQDEKKIGGRQIFHFFFAIGCYLFQAVEQRIREEQRMMDEKIVLELDQKVIDQQSTLEKAGVSGFYITTNPQVGVQAGKVTSDSTLVLISLFFKTKKSCS